MYFLKNKLESVKQYAFLSTHLYHINEQEMLFCDGTFLLDAYGLEAGLNSIFCYSNLDKVQTTIFSINGVHKQVNESLISSCYNGRDTLSFRDYKTDDYTHQIGLYNVNNASMNWFPDRYSIASNVRKKNIIWHLCFPNRVKCLSLTTGSYEWQTILDVKRITKIVGIFADKLIVTYEMDQNQTGAAALDTYTGTILWQRLIQGLDPFYATGTKKNTLINLKSGGLWQNGVQMVKGSNLFAEIDLHTGDVLRQGLLHELDEADLQVRTFEVKASYIYVTANHQGSFGAIAIGVLSLQTLKLLWWEVVKMDQAGGFGNFLLNSVTVSGNRLGILDKTGVLHLYEKQAGFRPKRLPQKGLIPLQERSVEPNEIKPSIQQVILEERNFSKTDFTAAPTQISDDLDF